MSTEISNESSFEVDAHEFSALAGFVLEQLRVHPQAELHIMFVEPPVMAELHEQWLGLPGPTDVMSFPLDELRPPAAGEEAQEGILGDVVLCPQVAAAQARAAGHSTVEELLLLTVHGILHLLGFDHEEENDEKVMFALQRKLLLTFLGEQR